MVGTGGAAASHSVGEMAWATAKMFGPSGSPGDQDPRRNLPGAPALDLWLAIPFYLGLTLALLRLRQPAYAILVTSLVGLLLPGIFSEYAPHFHRILGVAAPVALLCAVAAGLVVEYSLYPLCADRSSLLCIAMGQYPLAYAWRGGFGA